MLQDGEVPRIPGLDEDVESVTHSLQYRVVDVLESFEAQLFFGPYLGDDTVALQHVHRRALVAIGSMQGADDGMSACGPLWGP